MKIADKLKSIDYKKLSINHAEKFVVGMIGLLVLLIVFVPLFAGNFSGYDKTPEELIEKANETHDQIGKSQWPDADRIKYQGTDDLSAQIASLFSPVSPDDYRPSIEIAPPLYRKKEPRKEPDWLVVDQLLIISDRGHFEMPAKMDLEEFSPEGVDGILIGENGETIIPLDQQDDQSNIPMKFRRNSGQRNVGAGQGAGFGIEGGLGDDIAAGGGGGGGGGAGAGADAAMDNSEADMGGDMAGEMAGEMGGEMGGGGGGETLATVEGRGHRYALLTGVFNIRAQRERIAKALSLPDVSLNSPTALNSPTMRFDLLGFEVARKEGTDLWPDVDEEHEILDVNRSMQVLMGMAGFDFDPVTYGVTHQQITSPLPPRIVGEWGDDVAHPKISNYVLNTEDGKKLNEYLTEFLAGQEDKNQKLRKLVEKNTQYGFASVQRNMPGLSRQILGSGNRQAGLQDFTQGYFGSESRGTQQTPGGRPTNTQQKQIKSVVDRITAAGTLLLFRYFDFDVEPGKTYQYRVRLIFENPNFNVPVSELEDPESRLGEIRKTPWSKRTRPITVLKDTEYFLSKVYVPPGRKSEETSLLTFQWKPEIGTVVSSVLNSQLGQYIGGEKVTDVLKPADQTFEPEKVEFTSNDLLVDSSQGVDVNYKDHADLELPKRLSGKVRLRIMDEALVQDASGRLFSINPFSSNTEKQNARQRLEWQNQPWQFLKEQSEEGESGEGEDGMFAGAGGGAGAMGGEGGAKKPRGRRAKSRLRSKNKLKKNSRSFGSDADGSGM